MRAPEPTYSNDEVYSRVTDAARRLGVKLIDVGPFFGPGVAPNVTSHVTINFLAEGKRVTSYGLVDLIVSAIERSPSNNDLARLCRDEGLIQVDLTEERPATPIPIQ